MSEQLIVSPFPVPTLRQLQKAYRKLHPDAPAPGKKKPQEGPYVANLTSDQIRIWDLVRKAAQNGSGGSAPAPSPERES